MDRFSDPEVALSDWPPDVVPSLMFMIKNLICKIKVKSFFGNRYSFLFNCFAPRVLTTATKEVTWSLNV